MNLLDEHKKVGAQNFELAISSELARDSAGKPVDAAGKPTTNPDKFVYNRREFLAGTVAAGAVSGAGLGAMYFGYGKKIDPVRVAFVGSGDEGNVLIGAHNPDYLQCVAISDIRPYNIHRSFHGDWSSANTIAVRPGLMKKYGYKTEDEARQNIKVYGDYNDLIAAKDELGLEGIIIALPLHLHAECAIRAMRAGLHVLCEKLMGQTVAQCKEMGRVSEETKKLLGVGHQRHYSVLYDNAVHVIKNGFVGDVHHIRAQWHRLNDTWKPELPGSEKLAKNLEKWEKELAGMKKSPGAAKEVESLVKRIEQTRKQLLDLGEEDAKKHGYIADVLKDALTGQTYNRPAIEELIRWRIFARTGGGLMAELGSHQLDASTIFCTAAANHPDKDYKAMPIAVTAVGGRHIYPFDRETEDHVYCMYEFPGPKYYDFTGEKATDKKIVKDPHNKIGVTYSSINGNGFGDYGEYVMGTKGTMALLREADYYLWPNGNDSMTTAISVKKDAVLDTTASGGAAVSSGVGKAALEAGPISRGYTEELEHWAWCIRNQNDDSIDPKLLRPRCHPKVAMADAIIALTTNMAIRNPEKPRIEFKEEWFDIHNDATPEGVSPNVNKDEYKPRTSTGAVA
ncbi:MAG: Gfo/Idh/MocA family oxidoreductase [Pirellulales bacterium]|nr:Gfo/Idh/MocA family oxidoreductase [Pirellulales bacterium]